MAERVDGDRRDTEQRTPERVATAEESWARHTRVLDVVEDIRRTRAARTAAGRERRAN